MSNETVYVIDDYGYNVRMTLQPDGKSVFIKITDDESNAYEANIDLDTLTPRVNKKIYTKGEIYEIFVNSFSQKDGYTVFFLGRPGYIEMRFQVVFDGILFFDYEIMMPEKKSVGKKKTKKTT